jgi:hypothetical protein
MTETTDDAERTATDHAPTSTDERSHEPDGQDDAHGGEALGPVDVQAWGALLLGVGLGLIVAICVGLSISA